jgi:hypothetical protein
MRIIENKKLAIGKRTYGTEGEGEKKKLVVIKDEEEISYFDFFTGILEVAPEGGWGKAKMSDMRLCVELIGLLTGRKNGEKVTLEENQYEALITAYDKWTWGLASKKVLDFDDYIRGIEKVEANAKTTKKK